MALTPDQTRRLIACMERHPEWRNGKVAKDVRIHGVAFAKAKDVAEIRGMANTAALESRFAPSLRKQMAPNAYHTMPAQRVAPENGMTRVDALMRHDTRARILAALRDFVKSMTPCMIYEESEAIKACKVAESDIELTYWDAVTAMPEFAEHYGITERQQRIWGDVDWCAENMTGYTRGVDSNA